MALGRWLDAAEADDDGEATAARPLVTVPIERRELGGRRAQHPVRRRPPHYVVSARAIEIASEISSLPAAVYARARGLGSP